ncbi:hypothetical protein J4456_01515 [Candidatus Pacearchaeota archaeon]|nr:hypothetical protein [Candidatus Pacearchaeota archaeon]
MSIDTLLLQEFVQNLPPEMIGRIGTLVTIFQALGIVFIIYFIFLIVKIVLDIRSKIFIKKTYGIVQSIEEKLDKLAINKSKKRK